MLAQEEHKHSPMPPGPPFHTRFLWSAPNAFERGPSQGEDDCSNKVSEKAMQINDNMEASLMAELETKAGTSGKLN